MPIHVGLVSRQHEWAYRRVHLGLIRSNREFFRLRQHLHNVAPPSDHGERRSLEDRPIASQFFVHLTPV